ncbi:MAG: hypothetical protein JNL10_17275 [Verrucomicrobiales bacterium]|nr:hypothetical protein [Verrucomicrobiales bacterium]
MKLSPCALIAAIAVLVSLTSLARAQDVVDISLSRFGTYEQVTPGGPTPIPDTDEAPFAVISVMGMSPEFLSDPDNLIFVRAVTLQPPAPGALIGMDFSESFGGFLYYEPFASAALLESEFRSGNYLYTFGSLILGDQKFTIRVGTRELPTAPWITNFEATRQVDPTRPFTLNWTPESPEQGGAQLEVTDVETGELVYDSNPIFGAHTSAEIPANVLVAGKVYRAEVSATRVEFADPGSVPTRTAISSSLTRIELRTTGGGGAPLSIASIESNPDGSLKLIVNCTPNQPLQVQRSASLAPDWQTVDSRTPAESPAIIPLPAPPGGVSYYQAVQ